MRKEARQERSVWRKVALQESKDRSYVIRNSPGPVFYPGRPLPPAPASLQFKTPLRPDMDGMQIYNSRLGFGTRLLLAADPVDKCALRMVDLFSESDHEEYTASASSSSSTTVEAQAVATTTAAPAAATPLSIRPLPFKPRGGGGVEANEDGLLARGKGRQLSTRQEEEAKTRIQSTGTATLLQQEREKEMEIDREFGMGMAGLGAPAGSAFRVVTQAATAAPAPAAPTAATLALTPANASKPNFLVLDPNEKRRRQQLVHATASAALN